VLESGVLSDTFTEETKEERVKRLDRGRKRKKRALNKIRQNIDTNEPKRPKFDIETLFEFENKPVLIIVDDFGKIWFKCVDVARILEYLNPSQAIYDNCKDQQHSINFNELASDSDRCLYPDIQPSTIFIDESALYRLVIRSNKPKGEKFTAWVVEEVLPSIRKTGQYSLPDDEKARLMELNEQLFSMIKHKDIQISKMIDKVCETQATLKKLLPHYSPLAENPNKNNTFVVIEKNKEDEKFPYYAIRIQLGSLENRLNELKTIYPKFKILLKLYNDPNAVKLYSLMKEKLCIQYESNHFNNILAKDLLVYNIESLYERILN